LDLWKKDGKKSGVLIIFVDEPGLSEKSSIRLTWGQKGQTPVVVHSFNWVKRSMRGGLIDHGDGSPVKMTFEIIEGAYDLPNILRWCHHWVKALAGKPAYLIWDPE
jgi:hypothetical protein